MKRKKIKILTFYLKDAFIYKFHGSLDPFFNLSKHKVFCIRNYYRAEIVSSLGVGSFNNELKLHLWLLPQWQVKALKSKIFRRNNLKQILLTMVHDLTSRQTCSPNALLYYLAYGPGTTEHSNFARAFSPVL